MRSSFVILVLTTVAATARAEIKTGDRFVELDAKTDKGQRFRLKDMKGKWVLYTFGASWCEPCHKELAAWDRIAPKLASKVLFVAVNIDNDPREGKQFIDSLKLKHLFPVYMPDERSPAMKAYDPDHMPSTFVIDPEGTVRIVQYGYARGDEDKLASKLAALVK